MNWKIALVASVVAMVGSGFAVVGCGGDDCTRADDHFAECAASTSATTSSADAGMAPACSGARLCHSQCINTYTCAQITGNDPDYTDCIMQCNGK